MLLVSPANPACPDALSFSASQSLQLQFYASAWFPLSPGSLPVITKLRNKPTQLEEEDGDSYPLDCEDDKSLSTLWLENTIKWTGVGSL